MKLTHFFALTLVVAMLNGCADFDQFMARHNRPQDQDLVEKSYAAADAMLQQAPYLRETRQPILVGTFVNVNSLENSSSLGRIVAEQVGARLAQQGLSVKEMKLRDSIFMVREGGEFALSRSVLDVSQAHDAAAVVAGTYAIGRNRVYVNARMIRAVDGVLLAAHDYSLSIGPDTKALLASRQ